MPDDLSEFLSHRNAVLPADAEVPFDDAAQPAYKAADDVGVHMIGFVKLFQPFLVGRPASRRAGGSPLPGHRFHKAGGHGAHHAVDNEGPQYHNDNGQKNPSYNKSPHVDVLPGPIKQNFP